MASLIPETVTKQIPDAGVRGCERVEVGPDPKQFEQLAEQMRRDLPKVYR